MDKCPECGWPEQPRETREDCWRSDLNKECRRGLARELLQIAQKYNGPSEPNYRRVLGEDRWVK